MNVLLGGELTEVKEVRSGSNCNYDDDDDDVDDVDDVDENVNIKDSDKDNVNNSFERELADPAVRELLGILYDTECEGHGLVKGTNYVCTGGELT